MTMSMASIAALPESAAINLLDRDLAGLELSPWPPFPSENVISGNPNGHRGTVFYRDPTRLYSVGLWSCPEGSFRTVYAGTEFGHVITGRATITDAGTGDERVLGVGDHFFVAFGSEVIWHVHEEFRKVYTMYEASWVEGRVY